MGRAKLSVEVIFLSWLTLNVTARIWLWLSTGSTLNPGVALVATPLATFAYLWGTRGINVSRAQLPLSSSLQRRMILLRLLGISLTVIGLSVSWITYEQLAFHSLDHDQLLRQNIGLLSEGLGVIALWSAYTWSRAPLWGEELSARLHFPLSIAVFGLPWEGVLRRCDEPLQRLSADIAVITLDLTDALSLSDTYVRYWDSFTIYSHQFYLIVNETCAGANLLLSMTLYALGFGWVMGVSLRRAWVLVLYIIPLSICFNGLRVAVIFLLGHAGSVELATGPWHEGSGYLCQVILFALIALINASLDRAPRFAARDPRG